MSGKTIQQRIETANREGRTALIPFVTAGFPEPGRFWGVLDELDAAGADVIEIGIPFSDPVADGPVVEAASQRALEAGVTLPAILEELRERQGRYKAALVLMGYYNPILQHGLARFAADAAAAGVSGCIVPDLPLEESAPLRAALSEYGIALIPLVGINTDAGRMKAYANVAEGFVYLVSVLGTTGVREGLGDGLAKALERARDLFPVPLALGFGLSHPEQVAALPVRPAAVVFGSALLRHIDNGASPASFLARWRPGSA